jgi:hypothetical protein
LIYSWRSVSDVFCFPLSRNGLGMHVQWYLRCRHIVKVITGLRTAQTAFTAASFPGRPTKKFVLTLQADRVISHRTYERPHPGEGNPVKIGSGPAAVIPVPRNAGPLTAARNAPLSRHSGMGRQAGVGEPEDLSGCPRTVFGAKILCGLMLPVNPQSSPEDRGFFLFWRDKQRKGVEFPCCRATVRETKAEHATG